MTIITNNRIIRLNEFNIVKKIVDLNGNSIYRIIEDISGAYIFSSTDVKKTDAVYERIVDAIISRSYYLDLRDKE